MAGTFDNPTELAPVVVTPDEEDPILSALRQIDEAEGKAAASEPGAGEYLLNSAKRGLAGTMGIPGDIAESSAGLGASLPVPFGAVTALGRALFRAVGGEDVAPPKTKFGPATSGQYREGFGYDPNMKTGDASLRILGGMAEMGAAGGPLAFARKMAVPIIASTPSAGFGLAVGGDVSEGIGLSRNAGEAVGSVAGGLLPTGIATGAPAALRAGKNFVMGRISPEANKARAEAEITDVIGANLRPRSMTNLERANEVEAEVNRAGVNFQPSLPQRSNSPGLLAIEKQLVSKNPDVLDKAIGRIEQNEDEIRKFVTTTFQDGGRMTVVQRIAKLQRMAGEKLDSMRTAVDEALDAAAQKIERNPNNFEAGARVRDLVIKQKQVYRGTANQKYQATYDEAERLGVTENIDDVVDYTKRVLGADLNAYQQSEIPSIFRTVRDKFMPKEGKPTIDQYTGRPIVIKPETPGTGEAIVPFEELHSLYKRVNSDIASAAGSLSPDKDFKLLLLNQAKDMLANKLAKFEDRGFGPVAEKFAEANRFYRDEYLPRFKQGFGGDVLAKYSSGEHRVPNEKVVEMIARGNNATAAKDFKQLFDDVPEAWQALRDGYMDVLYRQKNVLGADGRINQKALDGFLRTNNQTLAEFPQVRNEFQQLALDNSGLLERQSRLMEQRKALDNEQMFKLFQGKPAAEVMEKAMTDPNVMRLMAHHARGSPDQARALARAIAERVTAEADPAAFFAKNRDTIAAGLSQLGKDHMKNVETAVEALTINRRNELPTFVQGQGVTPDPVFEKYGSSPRAMISAGLSIERGRSGPLQEASAFLGRWFDKIRRDHKMTALEAVFYDRDAAKAIANVAKQPQSAKAKIEWVNAMGALGIRASVAGQGDEP